MKHIFLLVTLCLLQLGSRATELHIPVKPDNFISDAGNMFSAAQTQLVKYKIDEIKSKNYGLGIYVIGIDPDYLSHLDTFVTLLCNKWDICGNDNTCLIVVVNNNDQ